MIEAVEIEPTEPGKKVLHEVVEIAPEDYPPHKWEESFDISGHWRRKFQEAIESGELQCLDHFTKDLIPEKKEAPTLDLAALSTTDRLIEAFSKKTGMKADWFKKLEGELLKARIVPGSRSVSPLFCPYQVMLWVTGNKFKAGKKIEPDTGWKILEECFPTTYAKYSVGDSRNE